MTKNTAQNKNAKNTEVWNLITAERTALANDLAGLTDSDLAVATELPGWTAKHVLAHTVTPFLVSIPRYVFTMMRFGGNLDKTNQKFATELVQRPAAELVHVLRDNADSQWAPPGDGPDMPLTEIAVHAQDIRRAIGLPHQVSDEAAAVIRAGAEAQKKATPDTVAALMSRLDSATGS